MPFFIYHFYTSYGSICGRNPTSHHAVLITSAAIGAVITENRLASDAARTAGDCNATSRPSTCGAIQCACLPSLVQRLIVHAWVPAAARGGTEDRKSSVRQLTFQILLVHCLRGLACCNLTFEGGHMIGGDRPCSTRVQIIRPS